MTDGGPGGARLEHLLERSAAAHADRIAVEGPDGRELTYRELADAAGAVRRALAAAGVASGDRVGLHAPKSVDSVAALFGILGAGAAYVPVDVASPPERNRYVFADCRVRAVVSSRRHHETLLGAGETGLSPTEAHELPGDLLLLVADGQAGAEAGQATGAPDGLAYLLYTSGSTGRPKGVPLTHANALAFVDWCMEAFRPGPEDRFSSHAPFHFDLSILDLYVSLGSGARLVLIDDETGRQPIKLAPFIAEKGITVWYSTPSILSLLVQFGRLERHDCSALRLVLYAGEVFPVKHLRSLTGAWPGPRYFNLYGPTETNVITYFETPARIDAARTEPFPIGRACSGAVLRVADGDGRPVPRGTEGELCVRGPTVTAGYWNLPGQTERAFLVDADGLRWYRTGDLVTEGEDGVHTYSGRRDRMVKRRGFRVELGEIEAQLYRHPDVSEAAVVATSDEDGVRVTAFMVWRGEKRPGLIELKRFSAEHLPAYMVPDRFVHLDDLPKTSTDKIDYERLKGRV